MAKTAKKEVKSTTEAAKKEPKTFTHLLTKPFVSKDKKVFRVTLCGIRFRHERFYNKCIVLGNPSCSKCEKIKKKMS